MEPAVGRGASAENVANDRGVHALRIHAHPSRFTYLTLGANANTDSAAAAAGVAAADGARAMLDKLRTSLPAPEALRSR